MQLRRRTTQQRNKPPDSSFSPVLSSLLSLLHHTFVSAGTYFVAVGSYSTNQGDYQLEVRPTSPGMDESVVIGSLVSSWEWLGEALSGVNGEPLAVPTGTLTAGSGWTLSLSGAAPSSTAMLVLSLTTHDIPFKGGVLVPSPTWIFPLPTNGAGGLSFGGVLGSPPPGVTFYAQYWIVDAAGPAGYSASNAFSGTTQ